MQGTADWCRECVLGTDSITSRSTSSLFSRLTPGKRMGFFKKWTTSLAQSEYLAYDVTSLSSYSQGISELEWGYNRDGKRLPQLNLGMYVGYPSHLPAFYATYPGSIVDKSHLPYMMAENKEIGVDAESVAFVMDKGFCTTANIEYMARERYTFVIGVEARHKATRQAIDSVRLPIMSAKNRLPGGIRARVIHDRFYGTTSTLHVFFDEELARRQRLDLYRRVDADRDELAQRTDLSKRDVGRLRAHGNETTAGKVFCAFVSLIATMHTEKLLAPLMEKKNLTKKRIISELEKAKVITATSGKRLMNPLTRLQKDILAPFGITEKDFKEFVART